MIPNEPPRPRHAKPPARLITVYVSSQFSTYCTAVDDKLVRRKMGMCSHQTTIRLAPSSQRGRERTNEDPVRRATELADFQDVRSMSDTPAWVPCLFHLRTPPQFVTGLTEFQDMRYLCIAPDEAFLALCLWLSPKELWKALRYRIVVFVCRSPLVFCIAPNLGLCLRYQTILRISVPCTGTVLPSSQTYWTMVLYNTIT